MNWKASLLGAIIVALAGLGVGAGIGAKTTTHQRTVTVQSTRTVTDTVTTHPPAPVQTSTTAQTSSTAASSGGSKTGSKSGGSGTSNPQYYITYLSGQDTGQLDDEATDVALDSTPSSLQLKGKTYQDAVAFDLDNENGNRTAESYQLPVPGFTRFSAQIAGLQTNASANASYKLTVYKNNNNPGATVLYSATFDGPSETHPMTFPLQGATDVVLEWTQPTTSQPDNSDEFIIANPVVS